MITNKNWYNVVDFSSNKSMMSKCIIYYLGVWNFLLNLVIAETCFFLMSYTHIFISWWLMHKRSHMPLFMLHLSRDFHLVFYGKTCSIPNILWITSTRIRVYAILNKLIKGLVVTAKEILPCKYRRISNVAVECSNILWNFILTKFRFLI